MAKLPSFEYKGLIFHNTTSNLFQTNKFGNKLIYKFENGKYYLIKDERLPEVIQLDDNPFSYCNNDNNWK